MMTTRGKCVREAVLVCPVRYRVTAGENESSHDVFTTHIEYLETVCEIR